MSESPEDRAKRVYVSRLLKYPWDYQTSVFFDLDNSHTLPAEMARVRPNLRRRFRSHPFLLRVSLKNHGRGKTIAWVSILTIGQPDNVESWLMRWFTSDVNVRERPIGAAKRLSMARAIWQQKPHNLRAFFGGAKVNRYDWLNKSALPEASEEAYQRFLAGTREEL